MKNKKKSLTESLAVNRRNFVKLLAGGALGTGLSPLPWKLIDDTAIFTQNFPWVPVPPTGEFSHEKTICKLCNGGCGIEVRKVDNRAVKIEGRNDYPVNPGGICPLGAGGLNLLYNEATRFTGPARRMGERGSGKFVNISRDEALTLLHDRISILVEKKKSESLIAIDGNPAQSTMALLVQYFLSAVGSSGYYRLPSSEDTAMMTRFLMEGNNEGMAYDLENSDFILSFGAGLIEGWGAPGRVLNAWSHWKGDQRKGKVKVVQVESRASNTASKSDQWIAAIPGTEGALALGIAHVIIREGLFHKEFVNDYSFGFNDSQSPDGEKQIGYKTLVLNNYSPSRVAEITGIDSEKIVRLAKEFAGAERPVALCGKGKGALNGSIYEFMAIHGLNALVGNINQSGGVLTKDPLPLSYFPEIKAGPGIQKPSIPRTGNTDFPFSNNLLNTFTESVTDGSGYPVDTLLVFSSNPVFTMPDGGALKSALEKIPFIVSFSPYRDETSYMADLILPDHNFLEKTDDIVWPTGLQYPLYGLTKPVVDPLYDTRNAGDVIIDLAHRAGDSIASAFPWKNYPEVLKHRVRGLFDSEGGLVKYDGATPVWEQMTMGKTLRPDYDTFEELWEKLLSGGLWYRPVHEYGNWAKIFNTLSGKFEFYSNRIKEEINNRSRQEQVKIVLKDMGITVDADEACMAHFEPMMSETARGPFPLRMVPYELINLASEWIPNPPYLNKTLFDNQLRKNESFAEINPETAVKYNLEDEELVIIESANGKIQVRLHLFEGAMPGIIYLLQGLGHTAYDDFLKNKGVNPNSIIYAEKDPLSGYPVWWDTPVRIVKV